MATSHNVDSRCRNLNIEPSPMSLVIVGIQSSISACNWNHTNHSSLLRTFGLNATSPYDSYLPLIFGKFALIWGYFQNVCACRFWGHWGQRRPDGQEGGFRGWKIQIIRKNSDIQLSFLCLMAIFPARNESKLTIAT